MKKTFSILAALLSAALLLEGCALTRSRVSEDGIEVAYENYTEVFLVAPSGETEPAAVYAGLRYTPEFFFGSYVSRGEAAEEYTELTCLREDGKGTQTARVSLLPVAFRAGPGSLTDAWLRALCCREAGRGWCEMTFAVPEGGTRTLPGAYTVEETRLSFRPVTVLERDERGGVERCEVSDEAAVFEFSFRGPYLTLRAGESERELIAEDFSETGVLELNARAASERDAAGGIRGLGIYFNREYLKGLSKRSGNHIFVYCRDADGNETTTGNAVCRFGFDGLFTITWKVGKGTAHGGEYVYFYLGGDGLILTDGTALYRYTLTDGNSGYRAFGGNLDGEDLERLEDVAPERAAALSGKKEDLLQDLADAFREAGLDVTIDRDTGTVSMDSGILFDFDDDGLSDEGKTLLDQFLSVYTGVLFDEKYAGFVKNVIVEGHTDTSGDYDYNLALSQRRADAVKTYCLESGAEGSLEELLIARGRSCDEPVLNADGSVNMDASRRVAFRFTINLE